MGEYAFLFTIGIIFMLGTMSPGPSFILVAKTAVSKSKQEGFGVSIGLALGAVFFVLLAIFGLYAILKALPFLYVFFKLLGATYLFYLAYNMWKHADDTFDTTLNLEVKPKNFKKAVFLGLFTQLSNPKPAIIIGSVLSALLPKNIPAFSEIWLCLIAFFVAFIWYSLVVILLSTPKMQTSYLTFKKHIDRTAGSVLGALGVKIALDGA